MNYRSSNTCTVGSTSPPPRTSVNAVSAPPHPAQKVSPSPYCECGPSGSPIQCEGQSCHPGRRSRVWSDLHMVRTQRLRPRLADEYLCPVSTRMAKTAPLCTAEVSISRLWGQEWKPSGLGRLVPWHPGRPLCIIKGGQQEPGWPARRWWKFHCQHWQGAQVPMCCPLLLLPHPQFAVIFQKYFTNGHFIHAFFFFPG